MIGVFVIRQEVAFGLISNTLLRNDDTWRHWYVSSPVVSTSIKMIVASDDQWQQQEQQQQNELDRVGAHNRHTISRLSHRRASKINLQAKQ